MSQQKNSASVSAQKIKSVKTVITTEYQQKADGKILIGFFAPKNKKEGIYMNENKKKPSARIELRVTAREKEKIQVKARKCGLSTTGYVKQRALGYEPKAVPPDALFVCLEKLGELGNKASSPELDEKIGAVLKQITAEFLLPGKG